jgi:hypothetical protein
MACTPVTPRDNKRLVQRIQIVLSQELLKRRRREEYRERVNELLGTSPAATGSGHLDPISTPTRFSILTGTSNHAGDSGQPCGFAGALAES